MCRLLCLLTLLHTALHAAQPVTRTFYVTGVECGSCVYMVQQSITETKGVEDATVIQLIDAYANVTYDAQRLTEHQIAQAVREAIPLHGQPYLATLKLKMPTYAAHASEVDAAFAAWKDIVWLETTDKAKGELTIHFHELKADAKKAGPRGWTLAQLDAVLKPLGAAYTLEKEG